MRSERPEYDPAKTMVFIVIGAVLVIFTDLFLFGGRFIVFKNDTKTVDLARESSIDISDLHRRHEQYMQKGILPAGSSRSPLTASSDVDLAVEPFMPIEPFDVPESVANAEIREDRSEQADAAMLQDIEPSSRGPDQDFVMGPPAPVGPPEEELLASISSHKIPKISEEIAADQKDASALGSDTEIKKTIVPKAVVVEGNKPKVAIIIDDMGLTLRSRQVEIMQAPLTLSYLPYAENLKARTKIARENGHELMVHMPMEAMNDKNGGPRILEINDDEEEFRKTVEWGLSQFSGYVGVNNHQGSRLTQDEPSMRRLMTQLKDKGIYFVDSKTIGSSVAEKIAAENGIAHASRDVFLDHEMTRAFVDQALSDLEAIARRKGYAIAIGHPHKDTIEALKAWLPTLEAKGIELVPASALVKKEEPRVPQAIAAAAPVMPPETAYPQ